MRNKKETRWFKNFFRYTKEVEDKKKPTTFSEIESRIVEALRTRGEALQVTEPLVLVGLSRILLQDNIKGFTLSGEGLPVVILVGSQTGKVYQFALKSLLPDLEF